MSKKVLGIDLGTGNSAVAVIENGKPVIVVNSEGNRTTPSVISLKNGERKVGDIAKRQRVMNPTETVSLIKRFMGVHYDKCADILKHIQYEVKKDENGMPRVFIEGNKYSPEELSSMILAKLKKQAEDFAGEEITEGVITCPAWFDNAAREATKLAGTMAGLNVLRVINEPTAAILASDIDTKNGTKKVLVSDIGQGTTDITIAEISDGMVEVLASKGDVFLGGSDWDNAIAEWLVEYAKTEYGTDLTNDPQAMQRILEASEKAKIELSTSTSTEINLPYITMKDNQPIHLITTLTRAKLEALTAHLVDKVINCATDALKAAKTAKNELDCILLVGGQSRSLAIREALKKEFEVNLNLSLNPDECVACGAAIQANIIVGGEGSSDVLLLDVTPISMGIETLGGVFTKLIEANTTIPCKKTEIFSTAVDNQPSVDIRVLQGERSMAKDNKEIGMFRLDNITPAMRGIPQIEVSFDIDANGILKVTAIDKATNKEQSITIQSKGSLTEEEIEKIKLDAQKYAESDKKEKENADTLNEGDAAIFNSEKLLNDLGDKVTADEKKCINEELDKMREAVKNKDYNKIKEVNKSLTDKWNPISMRIYNNSQQNSTSDTSEKNNSNNNSNIQDAEFEEVK